jgi:uncharacterized protein
MSAGAGVGFAGLRALLAGGADWAPDPSWTAEGYGELVADPAGLLDLPAGFRYTVFSRAGETMNDGLLVPGAHDGMAAFAGPDGKTILVRNHELNPGSTKLGAFGEKNESAAKLGREKLYDFGKGKAPGLGGTTTMVFDTREQRLERHWLSLAGTARNCAGGPTPWGSWITCEETVERKGGTFEQDHGYNFEVPSAAKGPVAPVPLVAMGRFNHEAIAVHARTGVVYQTEDRSDGLIYRYIPREPGRLARGGKLQALALADRKSADTRNWSQPVLEQGAAVVARWIDMKDIQSPKDDLRLQGFSNGAARFARGEGIWAEGDRFYFACTNGGAAKSGQIFRYTASPHEGTRDERKAPGKLELFLESPDKRLLEYADNLTVAPWGDVILCEDGDGTDFLLGVTPQAKVYRLGRNAKSDSEFAGATFSPDGSTLFVNMQSEGLTVAITGPWSRRAA